MDVISGHMPGFELCNRGSAPRLVAAAHFSRPADWTRPFSDICRPKLGSAKPSLGPMCRDPKEVPRPWAHTCRQNSERLRRGARLETVRGHRLGSLSCKPSGSPSGRRMAPRSTTSATARSRLRCLVQLHAASFIAHSEASTGSELPSFVKDEFDAFLECGILPYGFLRLRCRDCGHDKLVAFSCKRRGFCPSCGAQHSGAVTLIQRFGSAANLNIHLHGLVLDVVYRCVPMACPSRRGGCAD